MTQREPKFSDCIGCKFDLPDAVRIPSRCCKCSAGELFEEVIDDHTPNDNELMKMYSRMPNDG